MAFNLDTNFCIDFYAHCSTTRKIVRDAVRFRVVSADADWAGTTSLCFDSLKKERFVSLLFFREEIVLLILDSR